MPDNFFVNETDEMSPIDTTKNTNAWLRWVGTSTTLNTFNIIKD